MTQLSAQSIFALCQTSTEVYKKHEYKGIIDFCKRALLGNFGEVVEVEQIPMISPFSEDKQIVRGKSWGLSACSYDVRIASDLIIPAKSVSLANTIENFYMPLDVVGYVVDKSSFARIFVSAFNTLLDPGWHGNLTLELANLGDNPVEYKAGDPVAQIAFHWLDEVTYKGYTGKYQNQENKPVPAIYEENKNINLSASREQYKNDIMHHQV